MGKLVVVSVFATGGFFCLKDVVGLLPLLSVVFVLVYVVVFLVVNVVIPVIISLHRFNSVLYSFLLGIKEDRIR